MATLLKIVCFLFLVMETLIGMVANGSIVLINFVDGFRRRKLSPTDQILICLGLSRLLLQSVVILDEILHMLVTNTPSNFFYMLNSAWLFTNSVNLWTAACLSVFYLAKIAIFSNPLFLQVKQRFPGLVPWLLLGLVVFSAAVTIMVTTTWRYAFSTCNPYKTLLSNRSNAEMNLSPICMPVYTLNATFIVIPFMVFLSSSVFLISSLWKHMRRVQRNGTGSRDLNTQAHLNALKALASFAVLYLISFAAASVRSVLTWNNQCTWTTLLFSVSAVYPSGHAIVLILINPRLKQAWVRMVSHYKRRLSKELS